MVKVKELKLLKTTKKSKVTVKSLMLDVRKRLNKKTVDKVMKILENKLEELDSAKCVVKKLEKQIKELENADMSEIDLDDYKYVEE